MIRHKAVAVGMVMITKASEEKGISEKGTANRISELCRKYNLPVSDSSPLESIVKSSFSDKKSTGSSISLVVLDRIGSSRIFSVKKADMFDFCNV